MCGIAGSSNFDKAFDLYEKNLKRGYFSSGFLAFDKDNNVCLKKQKEPFTKEELLKELVLDVSDPLYYLFHSRAPTNSKEPYSDSTCHPFEFDSYYVAHNGIITNFKSFPESPEFVVDSSIIPYHLYVNKGDLKKTFELYEGLLTCWIYDHDQNNLKIVKAGSSLHVDSNSFSSVPFEGSRSVEDDGVVFWLYNDELLQVDELSFKYDNPYNL